MSNTKTARTEILPLLGATLGLAAFWLAAAPAHAAPDAGNREVTWDFGPDTIDELKAPASDREYAAYLDRLGAGFAADARRNAVSLEIIQSDPALKRAHAECVTDAGASLHPWSSFTACVKDGPLGARGVAPAVTETWRWYFKSLAAPGFCEKKLGKACKEAEAASVANAKAMASKWISAPGPITPGSGSGRSGGGGASGGAAKGSGSTTRSAEGDAEIAKGTKPKETKGVTFPVSLIPSQATSCPLFSVDADGKTVVNSSCVTPHANPGAVAAALADTVDRATEEQMLLSVASQVAGNIAQKAMEQAAFAGGSVHDESGKLLRACKGSQAKDLQGAIAAGAKTTSERLAAMAKESELKVARRRELFAAASRLGKLESELRALQKDFDRPSPSLQKLWMGTHLNLAAIAFGVPGVVGANVVDLTTGTIDTMIGMHNLFTEGRNHPCSVSRGGLLGRHEKVKGVETEGDRLLLKAGLVHGLEEGKTAEERCELKRLSSESISLQMQDLLRKYPELGERTDDPSLAREIGEGLSKGFRESWNRFGVESGPQTRAMYQFIAQARRKLDQSKLVEADKERMLQELFDSTDRKLASRRKGAADGIRAAIGELCADPVEAVKDRLARDPEFASRALSCGGRSTCPEKEVLGPLVCRLQSEKRKNDSRFEALSLVLPAVLDGLLAGTAGASVAGFHGVMALTAIGHQAFNMYKSGVDASHSGTAAGYYYAGLNTQAQYDAALGAEGQFWADVALTGAAMSPFAARAAGKLAGPSKASGPELIKVIESEGSRADPAVREEAARLGELYAEAQTGSKHAKRLRPEIEAHEALLRQAIVEHGIGKGASAPAVAAAEVLPELLKGEAIPAEQVRIKRRKGGAIEVEIGNRHRRVISRGKVEKIEAEYAKELAEIPEGSRADAINIIDNLKNRYRNSREPLSEVRRRIKDFLEELKGPCKV